MRRSKNKIKAALLAGALIATGGFFASAHAAELLQDQVTTVTARVTDVIQKAPKDLRGLDVTSPDQTLTAAIISGDQAGRTVSFDNDYVQLKKGDVFYLNITIQAEDHTEYFSVEDPDRMPTLYFFAGLLVVLVLLIGGLQGLRGLLTLAGSFVLILYVLLPGILAGYSPLLVAIGTSALIIIAGSYITHGFNKTTSVAVGGMICTVIVTGLLAYAAVHQGRFTGYGTEEAVYLNLNARGHIDMLGLLLGGIMIGLLGVLYDIAISQAISVEELHHLAPHIPRRMIFRRSMRIGREHIGALVNTLAIAYVGASLPLLLLFSTPSANAVLTANRELFAAEIIRILIGGIGLVIAVPITTFLAVMVIVRTTGREDPAVVKKENETVEAYAHHH